MLIVVSPAKSLDLDSPLATRKHTQPRMLDDAAELVEVMRTKSPQDLAEMMSISPALAELNFERFCDWERPFEPGSSRPAVLTFAGDTYVGLDAPGTFGERDFTEANKTLRILSGLYGLLRPLDLIQPYRLEMGSKLATGRGDTLYDFWGDRLTEALAADIAASPGTPALVNLASNEYFSAVDPDGLGAPVITPTFLDSKDGGPLRTVGFFAKRARGTMAGWMIRNRVRSRRALADFDRMGYRYDPDRSTPDEPVFTRATSS